MKKRTVGASGLLVSEVGLGTNNFGQRLDAEGSRRVVDKAIDLGITLFDTAESYGGGKSEEILGEALGTRRKDVIIATKWGRGGGGPRAALSKINGGSRSYIINAVEASLKRLKTDYIDLYQFHFPDPVTPIEETIRTLENLINQGKIRYAGLSNLPAWQVVNAQWTARELAANPFISCQDRYSLLSRDAELELIPAIEANRLGLIPYSPLAGGFLTGKYRRNATLPDGARLTQAPAQRRDAILNEANFDILDRLSDFVAARGHTLLELAISWLLSKPYLASVIAGATTPEQVEQNISAAEWLLSGDDLSEIDRLTKPGKS